MFPQQDIVQVQDIFIVLVKLRFLLELLNCAEPTVHHQTLLTIATLQTLFTVFGLKEWSNKSVSIGRYNTVLTHGCHPSEYVTPQVAVNPFTVLAVIVAFQGVTQVTNQLLLTVAIVVSLLLQST
jgi:hypothetical protein